MRPISYIEAPVLPGSYGLRAEVSCEAGKSRRLLPRLIRSAGRTDSAPAKSGASKLRQRAELTFKTEIVSRAGMDGCASLLPYSVRLVEQILEEFAPHDADVVFDPFSGTGTTALCAHIAARRGLPGYHPSWSGLARAKPGL